MKKHLWGIAKTVTHPFTQLWSGSVALLAYYTTPGDHPYWLAAGYGAGILGTVLAHEVQLAHKWVSKREKLSK